MAKRIAILGGGISGLTAAYELEKARRAGAEIDWHLYEASDRLGGIVETTRIDTPEGEYILEGGPDSWVTEKPWARELAIELGLEDELIDSNDATRKTYILQGGGLQPIPNRMRLMVPEDLAALDASPLFSAEGKRAYAAELTRAEELKSLAPNQDESVASFVQRHFGEEVLRSLAAPLLSGVFGGDVRKLSVRAVMPQFVAMEREHGSLIAALRTRSQERGSKPQQPIFTTLRRGMESLVDALAEQLPAERVRMNVKVWPKDIYELYDHIILATPLDATRDFENPLGVELCRFLPTKASSAILVAFTWPPSTARTFAVPQGFGFLVPANKARHPERSEPESKDPAIPGLDTTTLLATTFVDQKFPHRAPAGARILRAFFGGASAAALADASDDAIAQAALAQLGEILGPLPKPEHTVVRRWPRSLPQYEPGHLDRIAQLEEQLPSNLHLLGNSYRGVGLPDLIRDARGTARRILENAG